MTMRLDATEEIRSTLNGYLTRLLGEPMGESPVDSNGAWEGVCQAGWLGIAMNEDDGEDSAQMIPQLLAAHEIFGGHLFPGPIAAVSGYLVPLLAGVSRCHEIDWANSIVTGFERPVVLPLGVQGAGWTGLVARRLGERAWSVAGRVDNSLCTPRASHCYVPVEVDGSERLVRLSVEQVEIDRYDTADAGQVVASVKVDTEFEEDALLGDSCEACDRAYRRARRIYSLALDAAAIGGADRAIALTVAYTSNREQFGELIGSFQALQHKVANAVVSRELARSLMTAASREIDGASFDIDVDIAASRVFASQMYTSVAAAAIQCHGGYGFTWEQGLHLYFRRSMFEREFGVSLDSCRELVATAFAL